MASGIDGIEPELITHRDLMVEREPGYARIIDQVLALLPGELGARMKDAWAAREFHASYERPLLLLAALRFDALLDPSHPLRAALTGTPDPASVNRDNVLRATNAAHTQLYASLRTRAVQTNETSRAVTWLLPASLVARAGALQPITLVDLGASAGLNLIADALPMPWIDETGASVSLEPRPDIAARLGFDLSPIDVRDERAATWLRACAWPSDSARLLRLELGIACFRERALHADGPRLRAMSLPDVPAKLRELPSDQRLLCVQTIVHDYIPTQARERYHAAMHELIATRAPLATLWAELELDPGGTRFEDSAALRVRFLDRQSTPRALLLARTHPHPRQLFADKAAWAALQAAFSA